jgi:hypothetical protein
MIRKFSDLEVGTRFTYNNNEYLKIPNERVSCCHVNNAVAFDNPSKKINVPDLSEVETND